MVAKTNLFLDIYCLCILARFFKKSRKLLNFRTFLRFNILLYSFRGDRLISVSTKNHFLTLYFYSILFITEYNCFINLDDLIYQVIPMYALFHNFASGRLLDSVSCWVNCVVLLIII